VFPNTPPTSRGTDRVPPSRRRTPLAVPGACSPSRPPSVSSPEEGEAELEAESEVLEVEARGSPRRPTSSLAFLLILSRRNWALGDARSSARRSRRLRVGPSRVQTLSRAAWSSRPRFWRVWNSLTKPSSGLRSSL